MKTFLLIALCGLFSIYAAWFISRRFFVFYMLVLAATGIYAGWIEPRHLGVTRLQMPVIGLQRPIRAAVIADTQSVSYHWPASRLRALVRRVNAEQPDIIFLLGDYAGWSNGPSRRIYNEWFYNPPETLIPELGRLEAPMGVYAVLGNHDWYWDGARMTALLQAEDIPVLSNSVALAQAPDGRRLWVAGIDDPQSPNGSHPNDTMALIKDPAVPVVMIGHQPDPMTWLRDQPAALFAGHTHGGQICFPFIGCPISMSRFGLDYGLYRLDDAPLFVSRGVGTGGLPLRFLRPPEVVIVDMIPPGSSMPPPEASSSIRAAAGRGF